jgi:hypothetical protein
MVVGLAVTIAVGLASCGDDDEATGTATAVAGDDTDSTAADDTTPPTAGSSTSSSASTSSTDEVPTDSEIVEVWFSVGDGSDCALVEAFVRPVDGPGGPAGALAELVRGPTAEEQSEGASSFFSPATADVIQMVTLVDGLLLVDFADLRSLIPNASTSCGSAALRAQLDATAFAFGDVDRVRYQIEGSCDTFHNWLQTECHDVGPGGQELPVSVVDRASWSGCAPPTGALPDGRWFGYVTDAEVGAVSFDLACWFTGQAAVDAAAEDGAESPPPNDYHVRNDSDLVRSVPAGDDATVSWLPDPGDPSTTETIDYTTWTDVREGRSYLPGVWLEVVDGELSTVAEQYVP